MEAVVISLEELVDLVNGRAITCGPVTVRVDEGDLDGLRVAQALAELSPTLGTLLDFERGDG